MLSICIPTYNFDCSALLEELLAQIENQGEIVEVLLMDDSSDDFHKEVFKNIDERVRFFPLLNNVGRSKIRNLLGVESKQAHILFIDGDSSIIQKDFISKYIQYIQEHSDVDVICGGSVYPDKPESEKESLRWRYSKTREKKSSAFLEAKPYQSFTTNNFVIKKEVFKEIGFDERLRDYGHEDTLFGYELKREKLK